MIKRYGEFIQKTSVSKVFGISLIAILLLLLNYTGVVGAQGMDVSLNPAEGAPGTQVTANGNNWPAGHTINVTWDIPYTGLGNVIVDNNGNLVVYLNN